MTSPARWIDHRVADADVARRDRRWRCSFLVVQRGVGHDDAADGHRLEPRHRRQRAGAADLDVDAVSIVVACSAGNLWAIAQRGLRDDEAEPRLQVEPVDLVDDAVDVVAERRARSPRSRGSGRASPRRRSQQLHQRIGREAPAPNAATMPDWVAAGSSLISPQA